jgi:tRNA (guanine26-N2/guanine27-N2)-dimethyltransferase
MGGAFWLDPIHDAAWLDRAIAHLDERVRNPENFKHHYGTQKRLLGILHNCRDELPDIPFYYSLPSLCNTLRTTQPRLDVMRSALYKLGFKVSPRFVRSQIPSSFSCSCAKDCVWWICSHTDPTGIKTDAPLSVMYDILKLWQAKTVGSTKAGKNLSENSPGFKIMSQPQTSVPEDKIGTLFEVVPEAIVPTRNLPDGSKMARFQPNPTPMWGPGSRAGGKRYDFKRKIAIFGVLSA